ncbi:YqaA family protein [Pseudohalocynthiibacter aestuariivivens]|jgi:membrane protein YqaA with SNARE-associated domain|uniref:YqaA family protein n=1 Tax=Pseudohalocynthiibacter aestuariivivens TaxID=1591409 RepID=A0ABV5JGM8_9RHOB|nr:MULTISPECIES: YqaA family protein [Pseudohalocynthiibacter]MBS9718952.1 DedA family protein [Pseudohalocynthiibacter aestuariivivens]MCK0103550.1 DedA family protein [Pseudohalocynthiibacter sp. F2068]
MTSIAAFAVLFASAFTSATLLPGSSEAMLLTLLAGGSEEVMMLILVATAGNVLGSLVNWFLGRTFSMFRDRKWFPVKEKAYERAEIWYDRYGVWSLLLSWLPVIGDPITVVAGALRVDVLRFLLLVSISKASRYAFIAGVFQKWSGA